MQRMVSASTSVGNAQVLGLIKVIAQQKRRRQKQDAGKNNSTTQTVELPSWKTVKPEQPKRRKTELKTVKDSNRITSNRHMQAL